MTLQRGSRGVFVGFAPQQAGYLIYIDTPISGSHLITSHDVTCDDDFTTATARTSRVFHAGRSLRTVGQGYIPTINPEEQEQTGTIDTVNSSNSQDPQGLTEEGLTDSIGTYDGITIPNQNQPDTKLRRSPRIAENLCVMNEHFLEQDFQIEQYECIYDVQDKTMQTQETVDTYIP